MAQGNNQEENIYFEETLAWLACLEAVRMFLALPSYISLTFCKIGSHQANVKNDIT